MELLSLRFMYVGRVRHRGDQARVHGPRPPDQARLGVGGREATDVPAAGAFKCGEDCRDRQPCGRGDEWVGGRCEDVGGPC